jgi:hypothetical protein
MKKIAEICLIGSGSEQYGFIRVGNIEIGFRDSAGKTLEDAISEAKKIGAKKVVWKSTTATSIKYAMAGVVGGVQ